MAVGGAGASSGIDLGALTDSGLARLAAFLSGLGEAAAVSGVAAGAAVLGGFGLALIPSSMATGKWVKVPGPGDVSYFLSPNEPGVGFRYTTRDGVRHSWTAVAGPNGVFPGPDGREIARRVKTAAGVALIVSTAALLGQDHPGPKLCPAQTKGPGGGLLGREYEDFMKARFNPGNPTPSGLAYNFTDPADGRPVSIDDCFQKLGQPIAEYKGPNFEKHMLKNDPPWKGMFRDMMEQAERQDRARQGRPLIWFFAEKAVADRMRTAFEDAGLGITVVWAPMR